MAGSKQTLIAAFGLVLLFAIVCFPLMTSERGSNYVYDEQKYHLPAVRQIANHWPRLDLLTDSLAATAPGYHYFLATIAQIVGTRTFVMRTVNWTVSALVLIVLFVRGRRRLGEIDRALLVLPLATSNFFVKSASWVVTDNAALLLVVTTLVLSLRDCRLADCFLAGATSALATFVRQMNIWTAILGPTNALALVRQRRVEWQMLIIACAIALAPLLVLLMLCYAWGELVPPSWRNESLRISTAGPIYALGVFGLLAIFYLFGTSRDPLSRHSWKLTALAFMAGVLLALTSPTTSDYSVGRWGGYLWNASEHFPVVFQRSLLLTVLSGVGSVAFYHLWRDLRCADPKAALIFLIGLLSWLSTFLVNRQVFQRYFEPTVLVFLIIFVPAIIDRTRRIYGRRLALASLSLVQLAITLYTAHRAVLG